LFRSAIIAGMGALGSELAQNVGRFGPRQVTLVDQDVLEAKNIERSAFWRDAAPGEPKVAAAARALSATFPDTRWISVASEIADLTPRTFEGADLLLSAVDTDLARVEMAAIGARYGLDICDGGLGGTSQHLGRVSWFPHHRDADTACFCCLLSARRRAILLSSWEAETHCCEQTEPMQDPAWWSTAATVRRIARLQARVALRAKSRGSAWPAQTLQIDLESKQPVRRIYHLRSEQCPFHDEEVFRGELFPRCERAICLGCGIVVRTAVRIGWLRRWGRCEGCGASLQPDDGWRPIPSSGDQRFAREADEQVA
jgi:molybdopterin-synthase adenylyltransferase